MRHEVIAFDAAGDIQNKAEEILGSNEYAVDSISVLSLAKKSACTAYERDIGVVIFGRGGISASPLDM